ncbi:non-ribosomal peptide synthetase, partial [Paenibacillus sp. Marseille-Q4541]|uniref:non-ribosomal peptide synthetase n=1 Tax=Paenibacillus sp. Marseille-Q4541 TaxID=2831522 RepID=UPI0020188037
MKKSPKKIAQLIYQQQVTRTSFVPSVLEGFLPFVDSKLVKSLRRIQLSGEALPVVLANQFNNKSGGTTRLVNSYGPTEATVFATSYDVPSDEILTKIHIGRPLANMHIYILNDNQLCGVGMPGELCIGGTGVTRGYLNRPELTAEKFVDNPYHPDERIYRTGDLAFWTDSGTIEYLGRMDEQVKIRGYRIELGEITSQLRAFDGVDNAAVIAVEQDGDKSLCAYVVSQKELNIQVLKDQLSERLPLYMVPSHIMQIEKLPVTRNGKLDKKALPKPIHVSSYPYIAPRNKIENVIAQAFQNILGVKEIGIDDPFFELGGHSLRATKLVNQLEERLGIRFGIRDILIGQTVRNIAEMAVMRPESSRVEPIPVQVQAHRQYEMSSVQKRLYVIQQMQGDSVAYNIPTLLKVSGEVNVERLKQAFFKLGERHELLRTHFYHEQDHFYQVIEDKSQIALDYEENHTDEVSDLFKDFVQPFDMSIAPLLRGKVVKTKYDETLLFLDIHHIIYDDASASILLEDLTKLYNGESLPELSVQYKDYSVWQNQRDLKEQEKYWLNEFSNDVPVLQLHTDFPRPQLQSNRGSSVFTRLSKEHKEAVKNVSKNTGATEYMILLSIFMQLLRRYSRQESIVIGSPIAGRLHPQTEHMLGMFVNTLAIKGELHEGQTFTELVLQMKEKCLRAYENQEYPFENLVEKLEIERDLSRNPIFDVMFVMQNNDKKRMNLGGADLISIRENRVGSTFDLTVSIEESEDGYELEWEYCSDLFKRESIERMAAHFNTLAMNAALHPLKKLNDLDIMSDHERYTLLQEFNDTNDEYSDNNVISIFEEQVERTPDHIAVVFQEQSLSYRELNERANQVGRRLRRLGAGADDIIGIISERSIEMIVGMFGILKAGAAYLPIDPEHPTERITYMLQDSGSSIILVGPGGQKACQELPHSTVLIDLTEYLPEEVTNPVGITKPHDLAYVIYTSGTTGQPKGVMVEHRNLVNQAIWQISNGNYNKDTVMIQKTTYAFDGSAWEIFSTLLSGSKLRMITESENKEPGPLLDIMPNAQIALIPSMLRTLLEYAEIHHCEEALQAADRIYLAAEPITSDLLTKFMQVTGNGLEKLGNLYGPTECTVTATSYTFDSYEQTGIVPIGKPILNTQIYILDGDQLCGIGMPGELCIGGAGVARGYLNLPELTAEKFVENPFKPGERIYRTGDLARFSSDGNIEYLGRIGDQVKIRGYRIELGEIENRLREIDGIYDAAVISREDRGEKYLCAYVVGSKVIDLKVIREQLGKTLPTYMIPSSINELTTLPLTRNGKLDKKALPEPKIIGHERYVAPRNELETHIVDIFQAILNAGRVGIDDSFFELGGHSLRATRLVHALEQKFSIRLPLRELLHSPTVRKIAQIIVASSADAEVYQPITIQPKMKTYEMSSVQKRIFVIHQMQDESITYNIPTMFRVQGQLDLGRLEQALTQLCKRHDLLRTRFVHDKENFFQVIEDTSELDLHYIEAHTEQIPDLFRQFIRSFDLGKAPLMRVQVIKSTDNEFTMMLDIHHIIFDEASRSILFADLSSLYQGMELPELRVQYKDYTAWQNARDLQKQETYWLEEFSGDIPVLDMKTDFARPQYQSHIGKSLVTRLTVEHKKAAKELAQKIGATEYMVLLSAFMQLMGRYSRQEEIVVGSPIAGRVHPESEHMLGMFVNTLAIKGKMQADQTFIDFVAQIKEKCLKAYENQEYPFELLVDNVVLERDISRNPIFDVVFALQNNESSQFTLGTSPLVQVGTDSVAATFDLTVSMEEVDEGYKLHWEYCTDLFQQETIERMAEHFDVLLSHVLLNPTEALHKLTMMNEEEQQQVLHLFNDTEVDYPSHKTVIELFEEQAARVPERIAAVFEEENLHYRELNARANYLGHLLRNKGVGPDNIVGLITGRSLDMLVGIYGVLKAGGAYLPIDPEHPADRIRYMLNDSGVEVVLLGPGVKRENLPLEGKTVIDLTEEQDQVEDNLPLIASAPNLAYVIYTSGTTGQPKGVMIENRNLVHLATWQRVQGQMDEQSVMLQKSTYIFDAAVWEIFSSGLSGSKLVMVTETQNQDPAEL